MKTVKIDDQEIFQISDISEKLLKNDIRTSELDDDINRRLEYVITHKCDQCFKRMKEEWVDSGKLESLGVELIPTNRDDLINLITSRPEYKDREQTTEG